MKIGLEIHIYLPSKKKLFCFCFNNLKEIIPNKNICPICLGEPGARPILNPEIFFFLDKIQQLFFGKNERILSFYRKHYSYYDLPKGYQILSSSFLKKATFSYFSDIFLDLHFEEDAAKTVFFNEKILLDFNRAGVPLLEIVTSPSFFDFEKISSFIRFLLFEIEYLFSKKVFFKCDLNFSKFFQKNYLEVKNLNSLQNISKVINILKKKNFPLKTTLLYDEKKNEIIFSRKKETFQEYYFLQELNLPCFYMKKSKKKSGFFYIYMNLIKKFPDLKKKKDIFLKIYQTDRRIFKNLFKLLLKNNDLKLISFHRGILSSFSSKIENFSKINRILKSKKIHFSMKNSRIKNFLLNKKTIFVSLKRLNVIFKKIYSKEMKKKYLQNPIFLNFLIKQFFIKYHVNFSMSDFLFYLKNFLNG